MADKEIPDLDAASTLDGSEEFHVVQGGNSRRLSLDTFQDFIANDPLDPDAVLWAKRSCRVATTANHSLSGLADVDGVAISEGRYVLVLFQTDPSENGIYSASSGAWTRPPNSDVSIDCAGSMVAVRYGDTYGGTIWYNDFKASDTLDTDPMNWYQVTPLSSLEFIDLIDTPSSYSGQGGKAVRVKSAEDGVEFFELPFMMTVAVSDETTALTTGNGKVTFRMPCAVTLTAVRASVGTAPTGSTIIVDINENGSSILSTRLSIDASEKTSTTAATAAVISDTALADDAEITIDIDQIGSTIAGAGLKVTLIGNKV
jgi:hypothetical protein